MTTANLDRLLQEAPERRDLELKAPGPLDNKSGFSARAVRAIMGLSNLRDGGFLVVGVRERDTGYDLAREGLAPEHLATWSTDHLAMIANNHAEPSVHAEVTHATLEDRKFVVVHVSPFRETPTICKKPWKAGGSLILREGAIYVRSLRKVETSEVSTSEDMRALVQLAVEKQLGEYVETAARAGVGFTSTPSAESADVDPDAERFAAELEDIT